MKTETLRVRNVVDATRLGAWLRSGEGIGWLAAGTMPNSLYRMPFVYLFLACVFCYSCSFLFVVFCLFVFFFCPHWSLVDVPLIFFCPADHVPDWQPRILLCMVVARLVNVKKTTTTVYAQKVQACLICTRITSTYIYHLKIPFSDTHPFLDVRPTLMHTKNLYENGPNPFFVSGPKI